MLAAHGTAGFFGILFIGFFAEVAWNGVSDGLFYGNAAQLGDQALAALAAPAYAFVVTFVLLKLIGAVMPLRASEREEAIGMDVVQHGEEAYVTGEGAILVVPDDGRAQVAGRRPGELVDAAWAANAALDLRAQLVAAREEAQVDERRAPRWPRSGPAARARC